MTKPGLSAETRLDGPAPGGTMTDVPSTPEPLTLPSTPALVLRGQTFDAGRPAVMAIINPLV